MAKPWWGSVRRLAAAVAGAPLVWPPPLRTQCMAVGTATASLAQLLADLNMGLRVYASQQVSEHSTALRQDGHLCHTLMSLLLAALHSKAAQAAAGEPPPTQFAWRDTAALMAALCSHALNAALIERLMASGGTAILESVAQLVLHLPPAREGLSASGAQRYAAAYNSMSDLLNAACAAQLQERHAGSRSEARRLLTLLTPLLPKLRVMLQLAVQAADSQPAMLVDACYNVRRVIDSWLDGHNWVFDLDSLKTTAAGRSLSASGHGSAAEFEAAAAALGMLPLVCQAGQLLEAAAARGIRFEDDAGHNIMCELPEGLADNCLQLLAAAGHRAAALQFGQQLRGREMWLELEQPIWQLHSACCRLVHWIVSGDEAEQARRLRLLSALSQPQCWAPLPDVMGSLVTIAVDAQRAVLGQLFSGKASDAQMAERIPR